MLYLDACKSKLNVSNDDVTDMAIESLCHDMDAAETCSARKPQSSMTAEVGTPISMEGFDTPCRDQNIASRRRDRRWAGAASAAAECGSAVEMFSLKSLAAVSRCWNHSPVSIYSDELLFSFQVTLRVPGTSMENPLSVTFLPPCLSCVQPAAGY